jgi:peroxiredoxin
MGNYLAGTMILLSVLSLYIQFRQIKDVTVPKNPWLQLVVWVFSIGLGIYALVLGIHILLVVPAILSMLINIFFIAVLLHSNLPSVSPSIEVGKPYIDFTTVDSEGNPFTLSTLKGKAILLKFFRGHWCAYCYNELSAYTRFYEAYQELGIELVVISADTPDEARKMKEKLNINATVLSDPDLAVIDKYRIRHESALAGARDLVRPIAVPTAILISEDGIVQWIDVSTNYRVRLDPLTVMIKSKTLLGKA